MILKLNRYDYAAYWSFFCYSGCSFAIPVVMVELAAALGFPLQDGGMGAGGMLHVVRSTTMLAARRSQKTSPASLTNHDRHDMFMRHPEKMLL